MSERFLAVTSLMAETRGNTVKAVSPFAKPERYKTDQTMIGRNVIAFSALVRVTISGPKP